ncbi:hypothetical protein EVAR_37767_1 [Eumeta japonica]|uniref:Uncharacterized protein n=1 Tax=Eumeta variegata TaxID=151549 RepID=A0A4C1WPW7_EUMVA|nr:hypothetical protein EVAR_37767_1 [Eumeta japonica]
MARGAVMSPSTPIQRSLLIDIRDISPEMVFRGGSTSSSIGIVRMSFQCVTRNGRNVVKCTAPCPLRHVMQYSGRGVNCTTLQSRILNHSNNGSEGVERGVDVRAVYIRSTVQPILDMSKRAEPQAETRKIRGPLASQNLSNTPNNVHGKLNSIPNGRRSQTGTEPVRTFITLHLRLSSVSRGNLAVDRRYVAAAMR